MRFPDVTFHYENVGEKKAGEKRKRDAGVPGLRGRQLQNLPALRNQRRPPPELVVVENIVEHFASNDSLYQHIQQYDLPYDISPNGLTTGDGNCWWRCVADQIKLNKLILRNGHPAPDDHLVLRKAVANTVIDHPMANNWIKGAFNNRKKDFLKMVSAQKKADSFTDTHGIMVTCTAHYLNVIFEIVP